MRVAFAAWICLALRLEADLNCTELPPRVSSEKDWQRVVEAALQWVSEAENENDALEFVQLGKAASRLTDALQAWQPARVTAAVELLTDWGRIQEAAEHMAVPFSLTQEVEQRAMGVSVLQPELKQSLQRVQEDVRVLAKPDDAPPTPPDMQRDREVWLQQQLELQRAELAVAEEEAEEDAQEELARKEQAKGKVTFWAPGAAVDRTGELAGLQRQASVAEPAIQRPLTQRQGFTVRRVHHARSPTVYTLEGDEAAAGDAYLTASKDTQNYPNGELVLRSPATGEVQGLLAGVEAADKRVRRRPERGTRPLQFVLKSPATGEALLTVEKFAYKVGSRGTVPTLYVTIPARDDKPHTIFESRQHAEHQLLNSPTWLAYINEKVLLGGGSRQIEASDKNFDLEQTEPQPFQQSLGQYVPPALVFGRQAGGPSSLARFSARALGGTELFYLDAGEDGLSLVQAFAVAIAAMKLSNHAPVDKVGYAPRSPLEMEALAAVDGSGRGAAAAAPQGPATLAERQAAVERRWREWEQASRVAAGLPPESPPERVRQMLGGREATQEAQMRGTFAAPDTRGSGGPALYSAPAGRQLQRAGTGGRGTFNALEKLQGQQPAQEGQKRGFWGGEFAVTGFL